MTAAVAGRAEHHQPHIGIVDQMPGDISRAAGGNRPEVMQVNAG